MTIPCQKSFGMVARILQFLCVLVIAGFLFAPKPAQAQFGGGVTMTVIGGALNGTPADIATLNAALGNPSAPYDVNAFLDGLRAAFGDPPISSGLPATNSSTIFLSAGGGNNTDMLTIQNTLNAPAAIPAIPPNSGSGYFTQYFKYFDPYGFPVYPFGYQNGFDNLLDFAIVGSGNQGLATLAAALSGNAGAVGALGTVLYNPPAGSWNVLSTLLCNQFTSCANAANIVNLAIGGDTTAQGQLNTFFGSLLLSNQSSNAFDAEGVTWLTSLGSALGGSTNCLTDTDGDGIMDCIDPDIDGDGIPNNYDTDQNGDGTVDNPDTDGDGIPDVVDPTPTGGPTPPPSGGGGTGAGGNGGTGTAGGGSTPPTNDCDSGASAPLTGAFGADPCPLAEDTLEMVTSTYWDVAGEQFADHLKKLWTNEMLPSLKNMTAQWNASVIDQTRQFGTAVDSHDLSKQVKAVQSREIEAKKRAQPNERSCVSATPANAMTMTESTSTQISHAFKEDMARRSGGAPGEPSEKGPVAVKNDKLAKYCQFFNDPETNEGTNPCPAATSTVKGPWPNGDIDIEGFLLKDTVDLSKPEQFEAAKAILANLIEPEPSKRLTDDVVTTQSGRAYILRLEQIEAWRSIAHQVVAAMISRRTSIPLPKTAGGNAGPPPPPPPPPPPTTPGAPQQSRGTYDDFLRMLGQREAPDPRTCNSLGYCGQYQMGKGALIDAKCITAASGAQMGYKACPTDHTCATKQPNYVWTGGTGTCPCGTSMDAFRADAACQKKAVTEFHRLKYASIPACARSLVCQKTTKPPALVDGLWLTPSGLLGGAHLMGGGGVQCLVCGSGCTMKLCNGIPCDGNPGQPGTPITEYMTRFAGYDIPFSAVQCGPMAGDPITGTPASVSTGDPPPPPRPVGDTIREIRERAGVDPLLISDNPSYNEIMLAMTKERFLDPDYYARMGNQIGALKQEQASVKAYIAMQLQDVYILQEQINLLLAARASMRLNEAGQGQQDRNENMPVTP